MKVRELIEELKKASPDAEVILQKDSEGNGYSPLSGADNEAFYIADCDWAGTVYAAEWSADECCMEQDEYEAMHKQSKCVVLYPIN